MAYNEHLANRVREALASIPALEEKTMMGGLSFLIDQKMVAHVKDDELMIRCERAMIDELAAQPGASPMTNKHRQSKTWLVVNATGTTQQSDLLNWLTISRNATLNL